MRAILVYIYLVDIYLVAFLVTSPPLRAESMTHVGPLSTAGTVLGTLLSLLPLCLGYSTFSRALLLTPQVDHTIRGYVLAIALRHGQIEGRPISGHPLLVLWV
jgi:hypothetical protein